MIVTVGIDCMVLGVKIPRCVGIGRIYFVCLYAIATTLCCIGYVQRTLCWRRKRCAVILDLTPVGGSERWEARQAMFTSEAPQ